jgi:18S rRNA (adenine1779-N6/adenine1780-N6)-dimethyltransferase
MKPAVSALWTRRAVSHGSFCTTSASSSDAAATEKWDGRFRLHKPRGQHLLTNPRVLDAIARRAALQPGDAVLEVGPGTGNLTARLLASAASRIAAVEIDPRMVEAVTARAAALGLADKLTVRVAPARHPLDQMPRNKSDLCFFRRQVITGDAVEVDFPEFDVCVANIPYGISSPLIAKLLFGPYRFRMATLLLQKEFARRLVATPGDGEYNRLAANVRLVADVKLLMDVSKRDFVPMPRVDSSVVEIWPRAVAPGVDLAEWLAFTRVCFGQKNKTMGAIFKQKRMVTELFSRSQRAVGRESSAGGVGLGGALDDDSDEDLSGKDDGTVGFKDDELGSFKERIAGALESAELAGNRPSKLSNDELLRLLRLFNERGVRFQ